MSPMLVNTRRTSDLLDPWAEVFFGEKIAVKDTFTVWHPGNLGEIEPGQVRTRSFTMTQPGVPLAMVTIPAGVRVVGMKAGATQIGPVSVDDDNERMGLRGCACVEGETIVVDLKNESSERKTLGEARLLCADPPRLFIPDGPYSNDNPVVADMKQRFHVSVSYRVADGHPVPLLQDLVFLGMKALPPRRCRQCSAPFEDDREASCEVIAPREGWLAPLAVVIDAEVAEHYDVASLIMGEMTIVHRRRALPGELFVLGRRDRPPLPFFALPPRQNLTLEGLRIGHRKVPPFTATAICAKVKDPPWGKHA